MIEEKVVALYIRLSKADKETGESKDESDSIKSQRAMLHQFLDKHPDLAHYPRYEAIDDGFSATNGNRPKFQEMVQRAERGEIQAILVKDSSRLFRDYVEAGKFMDYNFPLWNVRYIAIGDGHDSEEHKGVTCGMEQAFRNIIYANYPKMLSRNIKSAYSQLAQQGKFAGSSAPFGFSIHPREKNKLVIDDESALTIRLIFEKALEGKNCTEIALELNDENIETMSSYSQRKHPTQEKFKNKSPENCWCSQTIYSILRNQVYTGALVSLRRTREEVGSKKTVKIEPIIVEDTHQGIVTKSEFELAQKVIKAPTMLKERGRNEYSLRGIARCGHCKNAMTRIKLKNSAYFKCITSRYNNNVPCRKENHYNEEELENIVYRAISDYVDLVNASLTSQKTKKIETEGDYVSITKEIAQLEKEIKTQKSYKFQDYERYSSGLITQEAFLQRKEKADNKIEELEATVTEREGKRDILSNSPIQGTGDLEQLVEDFQHSEKLTSELAQAFVKAIYVYDKDTIEILFNFNDVI